MSEALTTEALHERSCSHPFGQLGHHIDGDVVIINAFIPDADTVTVSDLAGNVFCELHPTAPSGFTGTCAIGDFCYPYQLHVKQGTHAYAYIDSYQFKDEAYHAVHFIDHAPENLYKQAGAQLIETQSGVKGVRFAVFAPNASSVSVIGGFNYWNTLTHQMQKTDMGFWVLFVPGVDVGDEYKFAIKDAHGVELPDKSDPLGFHQQQYPSHTSVVHDHASYQWRDADWKKQQAVNKYQQPMSIYEVHLGSWKRPKDDCRYMSYRALATELINHVADMGYTHIEVLPVSEFPFDGSWGYQPVGLFAPTSRFGEPDDFKFFVDTCHQKGIGVIVDWVPAHFPNDPHGLATFDGSHVYEYDDPRKGWHPDWNSCIYDFGKDTVRQFLVANALFWFDKYHVDGIRVDAVASMLYLDYSRNEGEWVPNVHGGNHNYEAISFLQWMNCHVYEKYPNGMTIAEESTSYAGVSRPVSDGGLGFGFKWNMGWMHDSLKYISKDPMYRRYHHGELSFSMVYAYNENFVLPISHDEVVHGKGSMLQKMPGDDWQKLSNYRAYFAFMYAHPGKKLTFMGTELAPLLEWDHDSELDWGLLKNDAHAAIRLLIKDLNTLYKTHPALYQLDHEAAGFEWIELHNEEQSIFTFARFAKNRKKHLVVVCNFTPMPHQFARTGFPLAGQYKLIFNSDDAKYGGSQYPMHEKITTQNTPWQGKDQSAEINVPPLGVAIYAYEQP